jgi:capsular polysaccharide export protein
MALSGSSTTAGSARVVPFPTARPTAAERQPFLRVPPFPGARISSFCVAEPGAVVGDDLAEQVRRLKVGGAYWGAQPKLPDGYVLVRSSEAVELAALRFPNRQVVLWAAEADDYHGDVTAVSGECDPWHMVSWASATIVDDGDELHVIARLADVPCYVVGHQGAEPVLCEEDPAVILKSALGARSYRNPFTGERMSVSEAIELCGFWRRLVDSNRGIEAALGFAFWKQAHVAPLLWAGAERIKFLRSGREVRAGQAIAVWRSKMPVAAATEIERRNIPVIEVEDGFLRSRGLGADCIPPLSITVDRLGAHFDPTIRSELEQLLELGDFDEQLLERAKELRRVVIEAGLGKYGSGVASIDRRAGARRHILVPGQVEDDRAVQTGGCGLVSNLDLLKRVRDQAPEAYILYKPHPDVVAGHRRGAISDRHCLQYADEVVADGSIASLIAMVDEVHVNTSLAGFEALLRGKDVTTYGVPFYAGWGLTNDLGPVPARRAARRTLDELVAATLLVYPRYLDPVTGLPCPAEIVVARLSGGEGSDPGVIVGVRRLQGRLMRRLRSLVQ